jgi:hypothetical protein
MCWWYVAGLGNQLSPVEAAVCALYDMIDAHLGLHAPSRLHIEQASLPPEVAQLQAEAGECHSIHLYCAHKVEHSVNIVDLVHGSC